MKREIEGTEKQRDNKRALERNRERDTERGRQRDRESFREKSVNNRGGEFFWILELVQNKDHNGIKFKKHDRCQL